MDSTFLTISEAAAFIDKSDVTIRRLIKCLLKNRTSETDRCIVQKNENGKRLYRIENRFLVQHANLKAATRDRLIRQIDQMNNQTVNDQAVNTQTSDLPNQPDSQVDSRIEELNSPANQSTNQVNNPTIQNRSQSKDDYSNDKANDQTAVQTGGDLPTQIHENGSGLLKEALDELRSQLNKKDEQIAEKDKQIAAKDSTIDGLNDSVQKLTDSINQGNFLVASAQQRIPLPADANRETISTQHAESESDVVDVDQENGKQDTVEKGTETVSQVPRS